MSYCVDRAFVSAYQRAVHALYRQKSTLFAWVTDYESRYWDAVERELTFRFDEHAYWGAAERSMRWHASRA